MIFAFRSSAALFCRRYQSTANAQGRRHPIKAKGGEEKTGPTNVGSSIRYPKDKATRLQSQR